MTERYIRVAASALLLLVGACTPRQLGPDLPAFIPSGHFGERVRVLALEPGVTATIVAPAHLDAGIARART